MVQMAKKEATVLEKEEQDIVLKAAQNLSASTSNMAVTAKAGIKI